MFEVYMPRIESSTARGSAVLHDVNLIKGRGGYKVPGVGPLRRNFILPHPAPRAFLSVHQLLRPSPFARARCERCAWLLSRGYRERKREEGEERTCYSFQRKGSKVTYRSTEIP